MKRFILVISALLLVGAIDVSAKPKKLTKTITWELHDNGTLSLKGYGAMPAQKKYDYKSYPWWKKSKQIKRVEIGHGITSIGDCAFWKCYLLKCTTIPHSVNRIGEYAFLSCKSLKSITIPDSVTSIGEEAFTDCFSSPTTITIPKNVTSIGRHAFTLCSGELFVECNIPDASYFDAPFGYSSFTKVTFGNSVRKIGGYAFRGCSRIQNIIFGDNIQSIGHYAFMVDRGEDKELGTADDVLYNGEITNLPHFITAANCEKIGISLSAYKRAVGTSCHDYYMQAEELQPQEAIKLYIKGINAKEEPGEQYTRKDCYAAAGKCYLTLKQNANALNIFKRAKALGYDGFDSDIKTLEESMLKDKAQKALSNGNYDMALKYYLEVGDWDSCCAVPKYFENKKDYQNAIKYYRRVAEMGNNGVERYAVWKIASLQFNYLQDYASAFEGFKLYKTHYKDDKDVYKVPEKYKEMGDYANAIKYYKKIYDEFNESKAAQQLIELYLTTGRYNDAIEWYTPSARNGDEEAQYKLAQVYEKAKNKNMAIFWYKKSAEQKYLAAEEALADYGIFLTQAQSKKSSEQTTQDSAQKQSAQQTYTPEYGVRDEWVTCHICLGSGKCWSCNGSGWWSGIKCTSCYNGRCVACGGAGGHYEKRKYRIR